MRFGGHETFAVREDWLPRGLRLVADEPGAFSDPLVGDRLGVGRNMAKSIRHWLVATGLARAGAGRGALEPTAVGELTLERDPYLLRDGTWWALHANLATSRTDAEVWRLFFGHFPGDRFDRQGCVAGMRLLLESDPRPPSVKTLARDVACLVASYAVPVPASREDAEDGRECPFRSLGLLRHHLGTDTYRVDRSGKGMPLEMVGHVLSLAADPGEEYRRVGLAEALASPEGPGRVLALDAEGLVALLGRAEGALGEGLLRTTIEGGERVVRARNLGPEGWLRLFHDRKDGG